MKHLVLGGARSGKSRYAQQWAEDSKQDVIYIATAQAGDNEMRLRIEKHQQQRPAHWLLVEEPIHLADVLLAHDAANRVLLVDCLTLWLSNLLGESNNRLLADECEKLLSTLPALQCDVLLVSNEVGQGIVPVNALARQFIDEAGWLHQRLAALCDRVTFVVAGLPQTIKGRL